MEQNNKKPSLASLTDRTPRYTVKEMAEMMGLTPYAVRYYDNAGLIPYVGRSNGNIRLFSDYNLAWLKVVHCLRSTGLPVTEVRRYIQMCQEGDATIPQRAALIAEQERKLKAQLEELHKQMEVLEYKKRYYEDLLAKKTKDNCNPANFPQEPDISPNEEK
ncbi:MAG: MerR family transcriptional regulator [Victivallales bacterium]|nr:MerR family transcriptional regulator [Victivallales bacterium]